MKEEIIKILHLYPDLMNLYGDWANVEVLKRELLARGAEVVVDKKSVGDDIDFTIYDFLFIGSGTEQSQLACKRDIVLYKEALFERIEAGLPMLATGNSHELFGLAVTDAGKNRHEMLGLLDFETTRLHSRVTGDCVIKASFLGDKLIGFINRAGGCQSGDIERPFFIEPRMGASYEAHSEGIRYKNLIGTYLTGPVIVRNPPLLRFFADLITGDTAIKKEGHLPASPALKVDPFFDFQEKAYTLTVNEME